MDGQDDFGVLLGFAFRSMVDELHAHLAESGYGDAKESFGFAFKVLAGERLTIGELAGRLGITHQGAAKTVDEMVRAGYVERVPDDKDRRARRVELTERARGLLAAGHAFHQAYEERLVAELGDEAVRAARAVFAAMLSAAPSPRGAR
ncbi:MarR family winged helix-turn-helix transcriptional regulator [Streptomyces indicus]|uniref:MarR family protein n=1 Tax=Streptomyces indicus TaxID=417292 RepID=A0A1G8ZTG0_9ACTN|nr:MarR family transcriptional regulator [Streptomyces indicus]SDK17420.1 MarR family protein [Streptomyces indicus]